jgi:hypothetical protein
VLIDDKRHLSGNSSCAASGPESRKSVRTENGKKSARLLCTAESAEKMIQDMHLEVVIPTPRRPNRRVLKEEHYL